MNERHQRAFRSGPRRFIDEPDAPRFELREGRSDVVHPERDVVDAGASFLEVLRDGRIGGHRFEKLELRAVVLVRPADRKEVCSDALRRHFFGRLDFEAERVTIEREGSLNVFDGDPDVVEDGFHELGNRVIG